MSYLIAFLALISMIVIHELGHYLAGRMFKVPISEFSVGMGKRLFTTRPDSYGTAWSLRLFPFGGYCQFGGDGMTDDIVLESIPSYQKFIICLAGPFMNFIYAFVVTIIAVTYQIWGKGGIFLILKNTITLMGVYGTMVISALKMLITDASKISEMCSAVGAVSLVGNIAIAKGWLEFTLILCAISVNLGIMNLLPIVGFDGWKCLESIYSMITRRKLSEKLVYALGAVSMSLILGLSVYLMLNDVLKIISGQI